MSEYIDWWWFAAGLLIYVGFEVREGIDWLGTTMIIFGIVCAVQGGPKW